MTITATRKSTAVPTVTASSAYASGNAVGGKLTFNNVFGLAQTGIIQSAFLQMKSVQTAEFVLLLFDADPTSTTITDKAAVSINAADIGKLIARIDFATGNTDLGTHTLYEADALAKARAPGVQTLYGVLITKGTPTFAATSDVLSVAIISLADV